MTGDVSCCGNAAGAAACSLDMPALGVKIALKQWIVTAVRNPELETAETEALAAGKSPSIFHERGQPITAETVKRLKGTK